MLNVYMAFTRTGKPEGMAPRPELNETQPRHADMLRYDVAFHDPVNPDRVVFPRFDSKDGRSSGHIAFQRWHSWGFMLKSTDEVIETGVAMDWITFQHPQEPGQPADYTRLAPMTLREYLNKGKDRRLKLALRHR